MKTISKFIHLLVLLCVAILAACTHVYGTGSQTPQYTTKWGQQVVFHSFTFDAREYSKDIEVMDYVYKTPNEIIIQNPIERRREGRAQQGEGQTGVMTVGETLYVKWKIKSTGEVVEKTIDLRPLLPKNMKDKTSFYS